MRALAAATARNARSRRWLCPDVRDASCVSRGAGTSVSDTSAIVQPDATSSQTRLPGARRFEQQPADDRLPTMNGHRAIEPHRSVGLRPRSQVLSACRHRAAAAIGADTSRQQGGPDQDRHECPGEGHQEQGRRHREAGGQIASLERGIAVRQVASRRGSPRCALSWNAAGNHADGGRIEPARRKPDREQRQVPARAEEKRGIEQRQARGAKVVVNDCGVRVAPLN